MQKLTPKEVQQNVEMCDDPDCFNKFTPYKKQDGSRFCRKHK